MKMRWVLIGGPVAVGAVVGITLLVSLYEAPCACAEAPRPRYVRDHLAGYRRALTEFDAAHATTMCPASLDVLADLDLGTQRDETLLLDCRLSGEPVTRTITIKDSGGDGRWGTADDRAYVLTPAPRATAAATPPTP